MAASTRSSGSRSTATPRHLHPVLPAVQVVERPQRQPQVEGVVGVGERAGVPEPGLDAREPGGLLDVARHEVQEGDPVTPLGQPARVHPGAAADVDDPHPVVGVVQEAPEHLAGAQQLHQVVR